MYNEDGILFGEDGVYISRSDGRIYIRKETMVNGKINSERVIMVIMFTTLLMIISWVWW